jgi:pimeloyl-ACP methyl ester carboxylesterase
VYFLEEKRMFGPQAPPEDLPGEFVDVDGRRLFLRRVGLGGPSIVFESGGASSSAMWWPLQDRLADLATVVAYDRAGLGWSEPAPLPRRIEDRAADLHAMLVAAGVPAPYVLVGLSYGGPLIRIFAARHPELVAGLVFVDISHEMVFSMPGAQRYLRRAVRMLRFAAAVAATGLLRLLRIRGLPLPPTALPFSDVQRRALAGRYPSPGSLRTGADEFESGLRIDQAMEGLGNPGSLREIPLIVLSHGKPFPGSFAVLEHNHMEGQQALAGLSSNSELLIAHASSHAIPLEEPQLVLQAVRRVWIAARERKPIDQ